MQFLDFTKSQGNNLSDPDKKYNFPGLKPGDRWVLCAIRWRDAEKEGKAPLVKLNATNKVALNYVTLEKLQEYDDKIVSVNNH